MMKSSRLSLVAGLLSLAVLASAQHGGGDKAEGPVEAPPSPRTVAPPAPASLPPRAASRSWLLLEEGSRLFADKRLGEALVAFKKAAESRDEQFADASRSIDAAMKSKEAKQAKGSLSALVWLLAEREIIASGREAIKARAGGSLVSELALIRERSPSDPLRGLIDATLLVAEEGGLSRIGDSLDSLRNEAARLRSYPEAEFRMGQVYLAEGETRLAELQLLRAYDMRDALYDYSDRIAVLDALAGIYRSQGKMKDYELKLQEIAQQSELFAERDEYYRNAMERTLARQGFDKFMALYRIGQAWPASAYARLGAFYLDAGRRVSVIYLAAASNAVLTRILETVKISEPLYQYPGLEALAEKIAGDAELSRYASETGLWGDLVLLGEALAATGERESAREIWSVVSGLRGIDLWSVRASRALRRAPGEKPSYAALSSIAP
jgi:hypothetical protein